MKKLFYLFVAIILISSFITACSPKAEDTTADSLKIEDVYDYEETSGGIKITKYKGTETEIVVPETINNRKVVSVGNAFSGNIAIKSIILPESCTKGNFKGCDNLEYLEFPGCKSDLLSDFCPYGIKTLILSGIKEINFSQSMFSNYTNLEYFDVSGANKLEFCDDVADAFPKLKTLCLSESLKYYHTSGGEGSHEETAITTTDNYYGWYTNELTTDNYEDAMARVFGKSYEIKIFGADQD